MIKRKSILSLCLTFSVVALCGCVKTAELSEEEQDMIAEYSAGVLLQQEESYQDRLVKEETEPAQPTEAPRTIATPVPTQEPVEEKNTDDGEATEEEEAFQQISMDEMYAIDGVKIGYDSYVVCREYPKKASTFQMTAKKDEKFFVVRFQVKNTTSAKKKVNLQGKTKAGFEYVLTLNGETYQPTIVLQENGGLNYLKTSLPGKKSEEAILVYNVPKTVKKVESATVALRDVTGKKECIVTCK